MESNLRIYMLAPALYKTGGTELAHQLVKLYNSHGVDAVITYVGVKENENPIHSAFREYVDTWCGLDAVKDEKTSVVIAPEIYTELLLQYKLAKKVIWWMSVDGFEHDNGFWGAVKHHGYLSAIKRYMLGKIRNKMPAVYCADFHLYQSEYARLYLCRLQVKNVMQLSDYLNDSYFQNDLSESRQNRVLYNPMKGFKFTKQLMKKYNNLNWIPLQGLTTPQVGELLRSSKVYIDFGNHPGKDRFPREAAISGCCVITGRKGSAANEIDIPIPEKYKFAGRKKDLPAIYKQIEYCLDCYCDAIKDFEDYRQKIRNEKQEFERDALALLDFLQ